MIILLVITSTMATNQQSINYDKLLSGNIQFKKEGDILTVAIDNNIVSEISEFVGDLNSKNYNYEKSGNKLTVNIGNNNIAKSNDTPKTLTVKEDLTTKLFNELIRLNNAYKVFSSFDKCEDHITPKMKDGFMNCKSIDIIQENNITCVKIGKKIKIHYVNSTPHMIYIILCFGMTYNIVVDGNKITSIHFNENNFSKNGKLYYLGNDRWVDTMDNTKYNTYSTGALVYKWKHLTGL